MLVVEALLLWTAKKRGTLAPKAYAQVSRLAKGWLRHWGAKEVREVTILDVERLEAERNNGVRSASALNTEGVYLKQFFNWAVTVGEAPQSPARTWPYRKCVVKRQYCPLSRAEEELFCEKAPPWMAAFARLAITTGLREGTIRELTWEMIGTDGILSIPGRFMKTREPHRMPLSERAFVALGPRGTGKLLKLPSETQVYHVFKRVARKAGISPVASPHDLRRTFVERLSDNGVPLQTIQALGAWKTAGVLLTHYCCSVPSEAAKQILSRI